MYEFFVTSNTTYDTLTSVTALVTGFNSSLYCLGLAFAATTPSSYYVPGPTSDYTIKKKLESANEHPVTTEDKTVVLNATTSSSDQIGAGSETNFPEDAFNCPVMCVTEEVLHPLTSTTKSARRKCKKLTKICVK